MKKITLLSLIVLTSISIASATSKLDKNSIQCNNKNIIKTTEEAQSDIDMDTLYLSLLNDFKLYNESELESIKESEDSIFYDKLYNDFENKYINETVSEYVKDNVNNQIYYQLTEDIINSKMFFIQHIN